MWGEIKNDVPSKLKTSAVAMIPHKSKLFRCILDLSFTRNHKGKIFSLVDNHTIKMSKAISMTQLVNVDHLVINRMATYKQFGFTVMFAKLDINDVFWRMAVHNDDSWNFCYVLSSIKPNTSIYKTEILVPNSSKMGWCDSPPFFCSGSETAQDIIEKIQHQDLPQHELEKFMLTDIISVDSLKTPHAPINLLDIYVDDFIRMYNNLSLSNLRSLSQSML